jgi:hypothetical protein
MSNLALVIFASFFIGVALGGVFTYMFVAARFEQQKQRFADELHRIIEREERAAQQHHHAAA